MDEITITFIALVSACKWVFACICMSVCAYVSNTLEYNWDNKLREREWRIRVHMCTCHMISYSNHILSSFRNGNIFLLKICPKLVVFEFKNLYYSRRTFFIPNAMHDMWVITMYFYLITTFLKFTNFIGLKIVCQLIVISYSNKASLS